MSAQATESHTPAHPLGTGDSPADDGPGALTRAWSRCFAAIYGALLWRVERRGNAERRERLLSSAEGTVVELGAGTGHNLRYYPVDTQLVLTEPEAPMAKRLRRRVEGSDRRATVLEEPAERLPLPAESADTVVSTLVLCTVDDPAAALAEASRVLRPGGWLLFIEHVAAPEGGRLRRWQERTHDAWHRFACGCHTNRETEASIRAAGFEVDEIVADELEFDLPLVKPLIWGRARKPELGAEAAS